MAWFPWFMFGNWAYTETYMIHSKGYIYICFTYTKVLITYYIISHHMTKCCWHKLYKHIFIYLVTYQSFCWFIHSLIPSFILLYLLLIHSASLCNFFWGFLTMAAQVTMVFNINMVWRCDPSGTIIPVPGRYFSLLFDPVDCHQPVNVGSHLFLNRWNGWNGWMLLEVENSDIDAIQTSGTKTTIRNPTTWVSLIKIPYITWDSLRNCVAMGFLR